MKKIILLILALLNGHNIISQTLYSGSYSSSDLGYKYTVNVKQEGNIITITEPNRENQYKSNGGNIYYHTEQKYAQFFIKVTADNKYYAGKQGSNEQLFIFSGGNANGDESLPSGIDNCPLYDKYLKLAQTDEVEVQAWAFCGAAALAKCTYPDPKPYIEQVIKSLKPIMDNPSKCPCSDVITEIEWKSVSFD